MKSKKKEVKPKTKIDKILGVIGPGITTGAADDDPSGIATYSQTGAQFGFKLLWTAIYMLPFMIAVQEACARIGLVSGKGLAAIVKENYNKTVLYLIVGLVVIANIINIGADLGAMAAAAQLILPINFLTWILIFTTLILLLEIFTDYKAYSRILKWLALSLLAYPITVIIVHLPWVEVFKATFIPQIDWNFSFFFIITGVLGTTISPYMFFWETSQEVEEVRSQHLLKRGIPQINSSLIRNMRIDNAAGMIFSEITTWSILVVAGYVLHNGGTTDIKTAADAAKALEPLVTSFPNAGFLSKLIFSVGIIGLGLLAIPVLSSSAAYAFSEAINWKAGLNFKFKKAHGFYMVIIISTLIGLAINFVGIDPVKALIYAAVLNGVAAVPLLFLIIRISANKKILGKYSGGIMSKILLWITFWSMLLAALAMFYFYTK